MLNIVKNEMTGCFEVGGRLDVKQHLMNSQAHRNREEPFLPRSRLRQNNFTPKLQELAMYYATESSLGIF